MAPTRLFFPGASGSGEFWRPVVDRLPRDRETRLPSWPGAGAEPRNPTVNSYRDLVAFAARRVPDDSDLVAHSMGGVVAMGLALLHPDKVRRLVLVATSGGIDADRLGVEDWREEYRVAFPDAGSWVTTDRVDLTDQLRRVTAATCLIWGDADPISPVAVGETLHRLLPSSALHIVTGGTHTLARDHPAEVAAIIANHLDDAPARDETADVQP